VLIVRKGIFDPRVTTVVETCLAARVRRLNRVVTSFYEAALRPLDLKVSQFTILILTAQAGLAKPSAICELLDLEASTLSRNVERMRARGWLEVVPGEDARTQPFRLTAKGRSLLDAALPAWEEAQHRAIDLVGERTIELLEKATGRLAGGAPR
jgi:DNA-binding MarR family transcriptional regulator